MVLRTVSLRLREEEFEELEMMVESKGFHSKAELIRQLIRDSWDQWADELRKNRNLDDYISLDELKKRL